MTTTQNTIKIFSYGTLQYTHVQQNLFGRELNGQKDYLIGYKLGQIENSNKNSVELSGDKLHYIAIHTGDNSNKVAGTIFEITADELKQADHYESPDYKRVSVNLHSGLTAWLYISINETCSSSNEDFDIETAITA